ncbi:MAG TPA: hypothetical protein VIP28_00130 [Nocardioides sp.]
MSTDDDMTPEEFDERFAKATPVEPIVRLNRTSTSAQNISLTWNQEPTWSQPAPGWTPVTAWHRFQEAVDSVAHRLTDRYIDAQRPGWALLSRLQYEICQWYGRGWDE